VTAFLDGVVIAAGIVGALVVALYFVGPRR
jgi:hypothetical protein